VRWARIAGWAFVYAAIVIVAVVVSRGGAPFVYQGF